MGVQINRKGVLERLMPVDDAAADRAAAGRATATAGTHTAVRETIQRRLRIFHFNDLHNHLIKRQADGSDIPVFAAMAGRVADARANAGADEIILFFGVGDDHTGSVFDELCGTSGESFLCDPAYRLYSAAGVDAITLGNHDFDRGSARLRQGIEQDAALPIFSANISGSQQLRLGEDYAAAAIAEVNGLRLGLFGLTTPTGIRTNLPEDPALRIANPGQIALAQVRQLSGQCDLIILLSHLGFAGPRAPWDFHSPRVEDYFLAQALAQLGGPPIIILGGHSHSALNKAGLDPEIQFDNVWVAQAGGNGRHFGEIEMALEISAQGAQVHQAEITLQATRDQEMTASGVDFHDRHVAPLWSQVAETAREVVAKVSPAATIGTEVTLLDRYMRECALANFMTDTVHHRLTQRHEIPLDFCLLNATALTAGLPPGPVCLGDWYDVMPYADTVVHMTLSGRQLRQILTSNAQRLLREEERAAGLLEGRRFLRRGFLHFSGALRYSVMLGECALDASIDSVTVNGNNLDENLESEFQVGVIAAIFEGGYGQNWDGSIITPEVPGDIPGFDMKSLPGQDTGLSFRQEVVARARELGDISPSTGAQLDGRLKVSGI